jgi:hypothetical protein
VKEIFGETSESGALSLFIADFSPTHRPGEKLLGLIMNFDFG